jgi:hypothetical protein
VVNGKEMVMPLVTVTEPVHSRLTEMQSLMREALGRKPTYCEVIEALIAKSDDEVAAARILREERL